MSSRKHVNDIDPTTGLARLPEGYWFEIERLAVTSAFLGIRVRGPFGSRVPGVGSVRVSGVTESRIAALVREESLSLAARLSEILATPVLDDYIGSYPPMRLDG